MSKQTDSEIHELTRQEIARQKQMHSSMIAQIIEQREINYRSAPKNETPDPDTRAARERAKDLLKDHAPASFSAQPDINNDRALLTEQRAREMVLKVLSDKDLVLCAAEAVVWSEENGDRWRQLMREITLTAIRLDALERSAVHLIEQCCDVAAIRLPMVNIVGGRPISEMPVSELTEAALAAGVVTAGEIRKARNG
jgi:hypothetical protein